MFRKLIVMRKVPSRNQRSKGIKAKHVLQICVLLGVCVWLIYQVKYSHDKKKEFEEKGVTLSKISQSEDEIIKLGRKDLPNEQEVPKNVRRDKEEEAEEENGHGGEEERDDEADEHRDEVEREARKHDEEEQEEEEEENKHGEGDGEEREIDDDDAQDGGNDGSDEQDQDKTRETVGEDEFIEVEKEREEGDGDEEESESNAKAENDNNHDEVDGNIDEAREEHYKADDASSAVSHENQPVNSETEKISLENSDGNLDKVILDEEITQSGNFVNTTSTEENGRGNESSDSDVKRFLGSGDHTEVRPVISGNSTVVSLDVSGSENNGTKDVLENLSQARNIIEVAETPMDAPNTNKSKSNTQNPDFSTGQSSNSSSDSESALPEKIKASKSTSEAEENYESSVKNANLQNSKSSSHSSTNQTINKVENGPIDSSDTSISHDKNALTDPDTLPDIRTKGGDTKETAAQLI